MKSKIKEYIEYSTDESQFIKPNQCEYCHIEKSLKLICGMTNYVIPYKKPTRWNMLEPDFTEEEQLKINDIKRKQDPNGSLWLCNECEMEHIEYWENQWNEYYKGLM